MQDSAELQDLEVKPCNRTQLWVSKGLLNTYQNLPLGTIKSTRTEQQELSVNSYIS